MLKNRKGQSTAEYAIIMGLVVAVAAGVLQVALKGGIRKKNDQAVDYLLDQGNTYLTTTPQAVQMFSQEARQTTVSNVGYVDTSVLDKGGAEKKQQTQSTSSTSIAVELINATN